MDLLGFGMEHANVLGGCEKFGVPIMDTVGGRVRFWYFDTSTDEAYETVFGGG